MEALYSISIKPLAVIKTKDKNIKMFKYHSLPKTFISKIGNGERKGIIKNHSIISYAFDVYDKKGNFIKSLEFPAKNISEAKSKLRKALK